MSVTRLVRAPFRGVAANAAGDFGLPLYRIAPAPERARDERETARNPEFEVRNRQADSESPAQGSNLPGQRPGLSGLAAWLKDSDETPMIHLCRLLCSSRFFALGLVFAASLGGVAAAEGGEHQHGLWSARHSDQPAATEYWDLSARMESGHFVFARFFITNEGPGQHTAAGLGTLVHPDGHITPFRYGRLEGRWTLSEDGLLIDIASLMLDMRVQPRIFELDSDKRGIKIHLSFQSEGPAVWVDAPVAHRFDLLEPGAPIAGSLWVTGMEAPVKTRGMVTLTHAWTDVSEADLVARQTELVIARGDLAVYATDFLGTGGQHWRWAAVRRNGKLLFQGPLTESEYGNPVGHHPGYPRPSSVRISGPQLRVEGSVSRELLQLDPIEVVPQPFRFILSLKMQPERITSDGRCRVELPRLGDDPLVAEEPCLISVTYLNPLKGD